MLNKNYMARFWSSPSWDLTIEKEVDKYRQPDSRIQNEWFVLSYVSENAPAQRVATEVVSLVGSSFAELKNNAQKDTFERLKAAMVAIRPMILEYRTTLLALDVSVKSEGDRHANAEMWFLATWLHNRCLDAFDAIINLPISKMNAAAAAFKPTGVASFVEGLETNGHIIKLIPAEHLTPEICLRAVTNSPTALRSIPGGCRTRELCLAAVNSDKLGTRSLQHVPVNLRDAEMCDAALRRNGNSLEFVPAKLKTLSRCVLACVIDGQSRSFVPKELYNDPEILTCVVMNGMSVEGDKEMLADLRKADPAKMAEIYERCDKLFESVYDALVATPKPFAPSMS
jgi:hypothetical protein